MFTSGAISEQLAERPLLWPPGGLEEHPATRTCSVRVLLLLLLLLLSLRSGASPYIVRARGLGGFLRFGAVGGKPLHFLQLLEKWNGSRADFGRELSGGMAI